MGSNYLAIFGVTTVTTVMSCSPAKKEYASFELYPVRTGSLTEMEYTPLATKFYLWSPTAEEVRLMLYDAGEGGHAYETVKMEPTEDGTWTTSVDENLLFMTETYHIPFIGHYILIRSYCFHFGSSVSSPVLLLPIQFLCFQSVVYNWYSLDESVCRSGQETKDWK